MRVILGVNEYASSHQVLRALQTLGFEGLEVFPTFVLEHVGSTLGKFLLTVTESEYY